MWPSSNNNPDVYLSGQWSFNAAAYQNIPYEQVDWASLAQQWIRMKETIPAGSNPRPPPPPAPHISKPLAGSVVPTVIPVSPVATSHLQTIERGKKNDNVIGELSNYLTGGREDDDVEGGEAPMDMDTKDEDGGDVGGVAPAGWGDWQNQWGWGWSAGNAGTVPLTENNALTPPSSADSKAYWREVGYSTAPEMSPQPSSVTAITSQPWSKGNLPKNSNRLEQKQVTAESFLMDAAKKKKLPAWIREGLTKMERDKQKKMDMERALQEKYIRDKMRAEELAKELRSPLSSSIYQPMSPPLIKSSDRSTKQPPTVPTIRRDSFEKHESSASPETSSPPSSVATSTISVTTTRPSPYDDPHSRVTRDSMTNRPRLSQPTIRKTKDQIMEESMLKVRRILTQILLETTEIQVQMIAKEEASRYKSSASSRAVQKSKALTSLVTGNLGVNVYDSDSQSSESEDSIPDAHSGDSDEELKNTIERKMHEFRRIEDEIELEIELREADERSAATHLRQMDHSDNEHSDRDDNVNNDVINREKEASQIEKEHRALNSESRIEEQQTNNNSVRVNVSVATNNTDKPKTTSKYFSKRKNSSSSSYSSSSSSSSSSDSYSNSTHKKQRNRDKDVRTNKENSSEMDSKSKSKRYKPRSRSRSRSPVKDTSKSSSGCHKSDYDRRRRSRSHDGKRHSRSRSSADSDVDSQSSSNSRRRRTTHSPNRRRRHDSSDKSKSKSRDSNKSGNSYSYRRNESDSSRRRRRSRSFTHESRRSRYK